MVTDFHVHVFERDAYLPEVHEFVRKINPDYADTYTDCHPEPAEFVAELRRQGIERAVVLAEHAPATTGYLSSDWVAEYCSGQDELIAACCINPNVDPDPVSAFTRYIDELEMRVLKLLPSYGFFYPDEPRMYAIYAAAEARAVPVLIHVGSSIFSATRPRYCDPAHLHDVARDFPELPLVLAHAGRGYWHAECEFMASHYPNVYLDLTGLPPRRLLELIPRLERIADKCVFGSDWPALPRSIAENIAALRELTLSQPALESILGGTADRLLGAVRPA